MTAAVLTQLPLTAGSALMGAAGRAALWGLAQYAKAPLSNTAIVALTVFSLTAGANALYFQGHRHPAPMFGGSTQVAAVTPALVIPAVRKGKGKLVVPSVENQTVTGSVPAAKAATAPSSQEPIGNAEVFELQRKLQAIGLFSGDVDGFYGPKTARAIKSFEEANGLKVKGELTREIIATISAAAIIGKKPEPLPIEAPEPVPDPAPSVIATPVAAPKPDLAAATIEVAPLARIEPEPEAQAMVEPLPAPAPLAATITTAATNRQLPATPQEAVNIAVDVAGNAVDAAVNAMQGKVPLGPRQPLPPKPQAVASVEVAEATPVAKVPAPVAVEELISSTDQRLVSKVQQGLSNLGFLHGTIDGVAGEGTAKAIRNFEVYFNYAVTGKVTGQLVDLLTDAGAYI